MDVCTKQNIYIYLTYLCSLRLIKHILELIELVESLVLKEKICDLNLAQVGREGIRLSLD